VDGTADFLNQHYLDYVGRSLEDLRDWQWIDFVHPDDLSSLSAAWSNFLSSGTGGEAEARIRRHDGAFRWFLFRADPLRDEGGNSVSALREAFPGDWIATNSPSPTSFVGSLNSSPASW
jgi:PAS domain S-box-containing protein